MNFREFLSNNEILFECVLNEVKYSFFKTYSHVDRKKVLIDFICQMLNEHSLDDKGIEYVKRDVANPLSLDDIKNIFNKLNELSNDKMGKIAIRVTENVTENSKGSIFVITINKNDTKNLLNIKSDNGLYIKFLIAKISAPQSKIVNNITLHGTRDGVFINDKNAKNAKNAKNGLTLDTKNLRLCFISAKKADKNMIK